MLSGNSIPRLRNRSERGPAWSNSFPSLRTCFRPTLVTADFLITIDALRFQQVLGGYVNITGGFEAQDIPTFLAATNAHPLINIIAVSIDTLGRIKCFPHIRKIADTLQRKCCFGGRGIATTTKPYREQHICLTMVLDCTY